MDLLLLHTALTWSLVGLIWTVQVVQYPGFALVGEPQLGRFHRHHSSRISWVVGPLMLLELATGLALLQWQPPGLATPFLALGLGLIGLNWASTALLAIPLHQRVAEGDRGALRGLVVSNWVRTLAWTARGGWSVLALRVAISA